jgi:NADH:ubiquinone oxidoreductase subunit 5 (subunit L)/multisubunit Na+/H+ antiporter MnhA subunit
MISFFHNLYFCPYSMSILDLICLFLFLGVVGKSAQLGLHVWLPEAMEGPTPVSALIHAATLVTAGVFLMIRCSLLFEYADTTLFIVLLVGGLTAIFGASVACLQNDIKKIIAFSTTSQLGYMVYCCGISQYNISLFHLYNHAFFKSLLFLSAGSIIHAMSNEQDLRRYGGLYSYLPFTYICMLVGFLALAGFPFLSGF